MDRHVISCFQWGRLLVTKGAQKQASQIELAVRELECFEQHKRGFTCCLVS